MAIVSRFSVEKAKSVKKAVKQNLTQRIRQKVGISEYTSSSSSSSEGEDNEDDGGSTGTGASKPESRTVQDSPIDGDTTSRGNPAPEKDQDVDHNDGGDVGPSVSKRRFRLRKKKDDKRERKERRERKKKDDVEAGQIPQDEDRRGGGFGLSSNEQIIPADAVLAKENVNEVCFKSLHRGSYRGLTYCPQFLQILDPAIMPLGIITLEDVVEGMCMSNLTSLWVLTSIGRAYRGGDLRRIRPTPSRSATQFIHPPGLPRSR